MSKRVFRSQRYMDRLADSCVACAERNGNVTQRSDTGSSYRGVEYNSSEFNIHFETYSSYRDFGAVVDSLSVVKVTKGDTVLLDAGSKYDPTYDPNMSDVKATTYVPGDWEKEVLKFARSASRC